MSTDATDSQCIIGEASVYSRPFDPEWEVVVDDHLIDMIYVSNPTAPRTNGVGWAEWVAWSDALHASWAGLGFGYDRVMDMHVKINDLVDEQTTTGNATLDAWARTHEAYRKVPYHPFNLSQACPSSALKGTEISPCSADTGFSSSMMYSAGIPGSTLGYEFWVSREREAADRSHSR